MSDEMPDTIWVTKEDDDVSAQIMGDLYAQHDRDGMVGLPTRYIRQMRVQMRLNSIIEAAQMRDLEAVEAIARQPIT